MKKQHYKVTKARRMIAGLILAGSFVGSTIVYASVGKSGTLYYQNNKYSVRMNGYVDLVDMPSPFPDKIYYNASIGGPNSDATSGSYVVKATRKKNKQDETRNITTGKVSARRPSVSRSKSCGYRNKKAMITLTLNADGSSKTITDKDVN